MIGGPLLVTGMLALTTGVSPPSVGAAELDALPAGWRADMGTPVDLGAETLTLYGDTFTPALSRNTVVVGDLVVRHALRSTEDTWYWPTDAVLRPDGSLLVAAGEVESTGGDGIWAFETVDTDMFVVEDPTVEWEWRTATILDSGPWDGWNVTFVDQRSDLVTARRYDDDRTHVFELQPDGSWLDHGVTFEGGAGTFELLQIADGWLGMSWTWPGDATLWRSDSALGPWAPEWTERPSTGEWTYGHGLNVVDGAVVWRWSNGTDSQRPSYLVLPY